MTKQALRAECTRRRAAIPQEGKRRLDELICRRIRETEAFQNAETVLLYAPVRGEIDLLPLVAICRSLGKEVGFPVSLEDGSLAFRSPTSGESLIAGAYGSPEPPPTAKSSTGASGAWYFSAKTAGSASIRRLSATLFCSASPSSQPVR